MTPTDPPAVAAGAAEAQQIAASGGMILIFQRFFDAFSTLFQMLICVAYGCILREALTGLENSIGAQWRITEPPAVAAVICCKNELKSN